MERAKIEQFVDIINNNNNFVLTCHTNADGDALGSTLGLRQVLESLGKEATVITPDLPPSFYSWLPGFKTIKVYDRETDACNPIIEAADVVMIMDYNELSRVFALGEKLKEYPQKTFVLLDHHMEPNVNASLEFSFPEASSTCAVVYEVLKAAGFDSVVDVPAATNLYTGIITDTGGLSYSSNDPDLYLLVADLLRKGIDKPFIHDKIFNNKDLRRLKLLGYSLLKRMHRIASLPLTIVALSADDLEKFKYFTGDTEGFVNIPLQSRDVIANVLILERPDMIKLSIRSKGDFYVRDFAAEFFGGGGHKNAAGGTFKGTFEEAVECYKKNIVEYYNKWLAQKSSQH
ncbi:MAG: DHH family phosphoesterase [Bacteroidales bacterium]|nr:DHH family phosphoesterase [Bacteroidales bacterium]